MTAFNPSPDWKKRITHIKHKENNIVKKYESQFKYCENEVGMKHPNNQSHIKIFDNGNMEMFAGDTTGIIISDACDTLNLYGNAVNVNTYNMNVYTRPYGFIWNGYALNPRLYQLNSEDFELQGSVRYWVEETDTVPGHWARRSISVKPFIQCTQVEEFNSLLNELGIPTWG